MILEWHYGRVELRLAPTKQRSLVRRPSDFWAKLGNLDVLVRASGLRFSSWFWRQPAVVVLERWLKSSGTEARKAGRSRWRGCGVWRTTLAAVPRIGVGTAILLALFIYGSKGGDVASLVEVRNVVWAAGQRPLAGRRRAEALRDPLLVGNG